MLLVQEYLKNHTFKELQENHGVYASFSKSGHKFSLNYDQIEAKESDPLAQECRGLILALADGRPVFGQQMPDGKINRDNIEPGETVVVAYPMKRFFNYGQGAAANINWKDPNLSILEKLDGTLCIVYFDKITNAWHVATRSVPEADLPLDNGLFTFRTLFEKALFETTGKSFREWTQGLNIHGTYCFELTTPYNRIVVDYKESRITLLSIRTVLGDFKELNLRDLKVFNGVPVVKQYSLNSVDEIIDFVSKQNPLELEGIVALDSNFNRIKIKNASYVAFSKAREVLGTSNRNCLELILEGKEDDVLPALPPEIQANLLRIKEGYRKWLIDQENLYNQILLESSQILPEDKKTFALTLSKHKVSYPGAFFSIFDKKANNIKDFIAKMRKNGTYPNSFLDKILESILI